MQRLAAARLHQRYNSLQLLARAGPKPRSFCNRLLTMTRALRSIEHHSTSAAQQLQLNGMTDGIEPRSVRPKAYVGPPATPSCKRPRPPAASWHARTLPGLQESLRQVVHIVLDLTKLEHENHCIE